MNTAVLRRVPGCLAALALAAVPALGAVVPKTPRDLATEADRIVIGDVLEVKSYWQDGIIRSDVRVAVSDALKGPADEEVTLHVRGGIVGDMGYAWTVTPMYVRGQHLLAFLEDLGGVYRPAGGFQGVWLTDGDLAGMAEGGYPDRLLRDQVLAPLEELVDEIRAVLPPGTVPDQLTAYEGAYELPIFNRYVLLPFDWTWQANPMGEPYLVNGNCNDGQAGSSSRQVDVVNISADTWTDAGADFEFTFGGTHSTNNDNFDGVNRIYWDNSQPGLPSGTIAVTGIFFTGGNITEWDMVWNDGDHNFWEGTGSCPFNHQDIQSVATHEFGHALGLDHTPVGGATMVASIAACQTFPRTLAQDDIDGIIAIYGEDPELGTTTIPFFDDFAGAVLDETLWTGTDGTPTVSTLANNEPSPPNSLYLNGISGGGEQVRSARMDATGLSDITLTYWWSRGNLQNPPEAGEDLVVEYWTGASWIEVDRQLGSGPSSTSWFQESIILPGGAAHSDLRIRFKNLSANAGADAWFIDDVGLDGSTPPINDDCANSTLTGDAVIPFDTSGATTDGPDDSGTCGSDAESDIWYRYFAGCTGNLEIDLAGLDYDAVVMVYGADCPGSPGSVLGCMVAPGQTSLSVPVTNGFYRIRVGGVLNAEGSGTMTLACTTGVACPADCDDGSQTGTPDGEVDVSDLLLVLSDWLTATTCDVDDGTGTGTQDGVVDVSDLLYVLAEWGTCP
ncbi:MAG: matrixin family metalloprotease [Planctomycetota bacterium]